MKDPNFAKLISFKIFILALSKILKKVLIINGSEKIIKPFDLISLTNLNILFFIKLGSKNNLKLQIFELYKHNNLYNSYFHNVMILIMSDKVFVTSDAGFIGHKVKIL